MSPDSEEQGAAAAARHEYIVLVLLCCFVVYSTRRFVLCLTLCHFVFVFFSPFSIAITSLGEERANLGAFRTFVRFCACLDLSFSSSSWCLGRAAVYDCGTPGLFSYLFSNITQPIVFHISPYSLFSEVLCFPGTSLG